MKDERLFRFVVALMVLVALITIVVALATREDTWQETLADSLEERFTFELTQLYWAWQHQGRPDEVTYVTGTDKRQHKFRMSARGYPQVVHTVEGCKSFFLKMTGDNDLNKSLEVSTNKVEIGEQASLARCDYTILNRRFSYLIDSAEFSKHE